jgi:hypothetical protein
MGIRHLTACAAVVATAAGGGAASALAATQNLDIPVAGIVENPCVPTDVITVNGTAHMKVTDNSSLAAVKSQIEFNFTGVKATTLTGVRYVNNTQSSDMQHFDFDPLSPNTQLTFEQTEIMNRQGDNGLPVIGDDLRVHVVTHLTVNSKGVPTSQKFDINSDCR